MPSKIPYDPELVLGSVVDPKALAKLESIAEAQAPVDAAQEHLNALLATKRSLEMTRIELVNLGIRTNQIDNSLRDLNAEINTAGADYAKETINAQEKIQRLREEIRGVHAQVESPLDYLETTVKPMALAADGINVDVQYFNLDVNAQDAASYAARISSYVAGSLSWLGDNASRQMSQSAARQVSDQTSKHSISGTLVLSASCTHKTASILAPLVFDVDKTIMVWNHLSSDKIDKSTMTLDVAVQGIKDTLTGNKISIISGMTQGSCFVGMVYVLNTSSTSVSERMTSIAATLQAQMDAAAWYAKASGGFGVDAFIAADVRKLLSSQSISSHVTMACMGVIPSLVSHEVEQSVQGFASFDPKASMDALATLDSATAASQASVKEAAEAARKGGQMVSLKTSQMKAALAALADIDDGRNKTLDVNSMMKAFEDYLGKAAAGGSGIPINYYTKDITKGMILEMWVAKYYPGKYVTAATYDDSKKGKDKGKDGGGDQQQQQQQQQNSDGSNQNGTGAQEYMKKPNVADKRGQAALPSRSG